MKIQFQHVYWSVGIVAAIIASIVAVRNNPKIFHLDPIDSDTSRTLPSDPIVARVNSDSVRDAKEAYEAAKMVKDLLLTVQKGELSSREQLDVAGKMGLNISIVERYYKKTHDCEVGSAAMAYLNYVISINENLPQEQGQKANELLADIKKHCP